MVVCPLPRATAVPPASRPKTMRSSKPAAGDGDEKRERGAGLNRPGRRGGKVEVVVHGGVGEMGVDADLTQLGNARLQVQRDHDDRLLLRGGRRRRRRRTHPRPRAGPAPAAVASAASSERPLRAERRRRHAAGSTAAAAAARDDDCGARARGDHHARRHPEPGPAIEGRLRRRALIGAAAPPVPTIAPSTAAVSCSRAADRSAAPRY